MKAKVFILIAMAFGIAASCTKEEVKTTYSRQEKNIESFINSVKGSIDSSYGV